MKWLENSVPAVMAATFIVGFVGGMAIASLIWNPEIFGLHRIGGYIVAVNPPPLGFSYCGSLAGEWYERGSACHSDPAERVDARTR